MNSLDVLGIESSCDDTAASVVSIFYKKNRYLKAKINASIVSSQNQIHNAFGGVVPELAARAHTEKLDYCVEQALKDSGKTFHDISVISVTSGPGLIGGLISGVTFAKSLSFCLNKPLVGVNHLVGHALTPRLTHSTPYPYLILIASGGHCQFLIVQGPSNFMRIGGTIDDAPGEAFDKTAKILGLGYPGGPTVEKLASFGDPFAFELPLPLINQKNCNMSFSGLKTALKRKINNLTIDRGALREMDIENLCASFQNAIVNIFVTKTKRAMTFFRKLNPTVVPTIAIAGGVAANKSISRALSKEAQNLGFNFIVPHPKLCTDNAAIIASAGGELFISGKISDDALTPRPRWPLDENANPMIGSGKKGRKA